MNETKMAKIINQRVALALSKQSSQQAPPASGPQDEMSPSNKRKSSVASTEVAPTATEAAAPVEQRHYLVDDITVRSACDILLRVRNKKILVAYGMAEVPQEGETYGPAELGFSNIRCAKVFVDQVLQD